MTGIRFYKAAANTGTHVGSLWTRERDAAGAGDVHERDRVGLADADVLEPGPAQAGQIYVAGYYAPNGHYSATDDWFYPAPAPTPIGGATDTSGPWSALIATGSTVNGLYTYASSPTFPTSTFSATNYWVEPVLMPVAAPGQVTGVTRDRGRRERDADVDRAEQRRSRDHVHDHAVHRQHRAGHRRP